MISDAAKAYLRLSLIRGVGAHTGRILVRHSGDVRALWHMLADELSLCEGIRPALIDALRASDTSQVDSIVSICEANDIQILSLEDAAYPALLKPLDDAPLLLFIRGDAQILSSSRMLAMVGSRKVAQESKRLATTWAKQFSDYAVHVVSGMAYGVDAAAHRGALSGASATIAVLGCGLLAVNDLQQQQIDAICADGGAVVSEFLPQQQARPEFFPRRNRIIAGLSHASLVVAAALPSGSLITASLAVEYGREVMAVPGSPLQQTHAGCHQLIRDGALLVDCPEIVFQHMQWKQQQSADIHKQLLETASDDERKLLQALYGGILHIDKLSEVCDLTITELSPILLALELQGAIERLPGGRYALA